MFVIFRWLHDGSKWALQLYHRHFFLGTQIPRSRIPSVPWEVHETQSGQMSFFCSLAYQSCNEVIFEYLWYFVTFCLSFVTFSFRIGIGSSAADLSRPPIVRRQPRGHWGRTEANGGFNAKILIAKGRPSCSYPSSEYDVAKCSNLNVDDSGYHFIPLSQSYQNVLNTDFPILDVKLDKSFCMQLVKICTNYAMVDRKTR